MKYFALFYIGGKCGCFVLINKWRSWIQSTLCVIWLYVQFDYTCNLTISAIWLYMQSDYTCNLTIHAIWLYVQSDYTCNLTIRAIWLYMQSRSNILAFIMLRFLVLSSPSVHHRHRHHLGPQNLYSCQIFNGWKCA